MRTSLFCLAVLALTACDDHPAAKAPKKLALPKGDSPLDQLLRKAPPSVPVTAPPHLNAVPLALSFAPQALDPAIIGSPERQQIRLTNDGGAPLTLGPLRVAGQASDFILAGECQPGLILPPEGGCSVEVGFRPQAAGAVLAELVIDQGAAGPSLFLPLSGRGLTDSPLPDRAAAGAAQAGAALSYAALRQAAALTIGGDLEPTAARRLSDPDYREAGLPGVTSSFPVDRARVLTADRYIPAVLENTLNSQLPGRAIAVVERPVFGENGRLVLIPAGARVIGSYRAAGRYGQARLDISWSRILRPDGGSINIAADAADVMGRAGVPGDLDQRETEKYGSSLLISVIGAAGDWALANSSTAVTSPATGTTVVQSGRTQAANRLGNDSDRLAQRMVEDNADIRPVLTVPQGTRLMIIPSEDIWLKDPDHLQPVTPPKGARSRQLGTALVQELLPQLIDLLAQSPMVQKAAPQTAQALLQSGLLQQLRAGASEGASGGTPGGVTSGAGAAPASAAAVP